jgi:hypothetical protein
LSMVRTGDSCAVMHANAISSLNAYCVTLSGNFEYNDQAFEPQFCSAWTIV